MKTNLILVLSALVGAAGLRAAEASPAPCCVVPAPVAKASCCPEVKPAPVDPASCCVPEKKASLPSAPLSTRSLYQLGTTWTNDGGEPLSLTALRGRPVIVAMIFAQCEYACPVLVQDLQRLRAALPAATREQARFVLVTFDTVRDTTPALRAFRERMGLDANWTLLRSDEDAVQELAMLLGVKFKQDARGQFAHSNLFTILNAEGEIAHQHAGLNGDISEAARVFAQLAK